MGWLPKIKIKRPKIKIKIPKVKIKTPKLKIKIPEVKIAHVEADIEGDIKKPGKIVGNAMGDAKDVLDGGAKAITDAASTLDQGAKDIKSELDGSLTELKSNVDREAEDVWRNIVTEFNYFFATVCGENSERKKLSRKFDQGEISATEYEKRKKDLPPEEECGAAAQYSTNDGLTLADSQGNPSEKPIEELPEVIKYQEATLDGGDHTYASITAFMKAAVEYRDRPIWPGEPLDFEIFPPVDGASVRQQDTWGHGAYGSSRGKFRKHRGVDFAVPAGSYISSPVTGEIDRITAVYNDPTLNGPLQAIVVKNFDTPDHEAKILYVKPAVGIYPGAKVTAGVTVLGESQTLQLHYPGITEHIHIQIKNSDGDMVPVSRRGLRNIPLP